MWIKIGIPIRWPIRYGLFLSDFFRACVVFVCVCVCARLCACVYVWTWIKIGMCLFVCTYVHVSRLLCRFNNGQSGFFLIKKIVSVFGRMCACACVYAAFLFIFQLADL